MIITSETPVRDIAVEFPSAIRSFERIGIDYCCHGQHTLAEACTKRNIELAPVLKELKGYQQQGSNRGGSGVQFMFDCCHGDYLIKLDRIRLPIAAFTLPDRLAAWSACPRV